MATRRERVFYEMTATDNASRVFRQVQTSAEGLGNTYNQLRGAVALLASAGFVRGVVNAAIQGEQSQLRLTAALQATGHQVAISRAELEEMAEAMAAATQFDDDSLRNAQGQLVKFGNIHGQVFKDALRISADLAAFMGTEVTTAVQQVGRALQSPTEGVELLERTIGKLTEAEERHIRELAAQGRAVEAQEAVLALLERRVGGTAELMNTELLKATRDVAKAWDDLLEAFGRTEEVQGVTKSFLDFTTQSLKDLKNIVENGDWVEKTLALLAFAGGWRGMKLTPKQNTIPGLADIEALERALAATPAVPAVLGGKVDDKAAAAAARARAERREKELLAEAKAAEQLDPLMHLPEAVAGAREDIERQRKQALHDWDQQVAQLAERYQMAADREAEFADPSRLDDMLSSLKEVNQAASDLGWAFSSAFEDAVIEGGKLRDVLGGMAKDVAKVFLREQVTKPVATALAGAFSGMFGGARAEGGPVMGGRAYLVGERGPELFMPGASGQVVPNGGMGVTINQTIYNNADTPTAAREAVYSMLPLIGEVAVRAVEDARRRGR